MLWSNSCWINKWYNYNFLTMICIEVCFCLPFKVIDQDHYTLLCVIIVYKLACNKIWGKDMGVHKEKQSAYVWYVLVCCAKSKFYWKVITHWNQWCIEIKWCHKADRESLWYYTVFVSIGMMIFPSFLMIHFPIHVFVWFWILLWNYHE